MSQQLVICPGCSVALTTENVSSDTEFNASAACRELCYTLSYYTLSLQDSFFIHQLVVDTYAAQHAGKQVKPIATTFALVGLYLVNEKQYTGKQVQQMHMLLASRAKTWPQFNTPSKKAGMTVQDVVQASDETKQEKIKQWSRSVWEIWQPEKEKIEALLTQYGYR